LLSDRERVNTELKSAIDAPTEQASRRPADAGRATAEMPGAFQLRLLQTVVDVAAEKNSTLVMPFPVELLRFVDQMTKAPPGR
jgi:hypothetical protein